MTRKIGLLFVLLTMVTFGACASHDRSTASDEEVEAYRPVETNKSL